jgi:hypothetical protein
MSKKMITMFLIGCFSLSTLHAVEVKPKDMVEVNKVKEEFKPVKLEVLLTYMSNQSKNERSDEITTIEHSKTDGKNYTIPAKVDTNSKTYKKIESDAKLNFKSEYKSKLMAEIQKGHIQLLCSDPITYVLLERGAIFHYEYVDINNKYFGSTKITYSSCKKGV